MISVLEKMFFLKKKNKKLAEKTRKLAAFLIRI